VSGHVLRRVVFVIAALGVVRPTTADALMFEEQRLADNTLVLWIRDCGIKESDKCLPEHERFIGPGDYSGPREPARYYVGDAETLKRRLESRRASGGYAEIRLWSGGGDLDEGVKLGRVLRTFQTTVRVVGGTSCVSACTVAFVGGLFRFIDADATYKVHSYSRWSRGFVGRNGQAIRNRLLADDPESELRRLAYAEQRGDEKTGQRGAREWAAVLLSYLQDNLLPLGRSAGTRDRLQAWLRLDPPNPYLSGDQTRVDADRIRREGELAAQQILMRMERDAMERSLDELRPLLPELGPRAEPALRMIEAMFSTRITDTATLSQETLFKMGYITRVVRP
jgi:hypothetical protein